MRGKDGGGGIRGVQDGGGVPGGPPFRLRAEDRSKNKVPGRGTVVGWGHTAAGGVTFSGEVEESWAGTGNELKQQNGEGSKAV